MIIHIHETFQSSRGDTRVEWLRIKDKDNPQLNHDIFTIVCVCGRVRDQVDVEQHLHVERTTEFCVISTTKTVVIFAIILDKSEVWIGILLPKKQPHIEIVAYILYAQYIILGAYRTQNAA